MPELFEMNRSFRAMNTDIETAVCVLDGQQTDGEEALKKIQSLFETVEKTLSRFNPESELSLLNASSGHPFKASALLFEVVTASKDAARITNGVFDPTILPALIAAGYDRSFEKLPLQRNFLQETSSPLKYTWKDIHLDKSSSNILMPHGCSIDLGGIGKGWTVDRACSELKYFPGYAIDAGGDIRVGETQSDSWPWTVGVADPFVENHDLLTIELYQGAICTSSTIRRKWLSGSKVQHHLIDPRSGEPSDSGVISATVIANSAVRAEILTKTVIILGPEAGMRFIDDQNGVKAVLILKDGTLLYSTGFKEMQRVA